MPAEDSRIYLDNNATTRPFPEVVDVMSRHFLESYGNPGSRHAEGRAARRPLEEARESIAEILDADPGEVIFTGSGTESTNLAIFGCTAGEPGAIALTAGEHPATTESCDALERRGWRLHTLDVDAEGLLRSGQFDELPWPAGPDSPPSRASSGELKLVTVILAHNETGVIQDLQPLAEKCRENNVWFHVDAVQAVGKVPVRFHELGATSLSLGAHKFHGPRGIGALLLRDDASLSPYLFGGHQESGRRPGTEPVALAAGMAKALEIWDGDRDERIATIRALRDRLQSGLEATCAPTVVNGSRERRLPNTLNIAFPGAEGEAMLVQFDLEGVACSLGSTCASGSAEPAPALLAMGCPHDVCLSAVRFSVSYENTPEEIDDAVQRIAGVVGRLREESKRGGTR
ncbi:MAG: cysteine desulfurase family protein [Planctomycetaceae bacterium]